MAFGFRFPAAHFQSEPFLAEQSALFRGVNYLSRTPSTAGNRKTFTFDWFDKFVVDGTASTVVAVDDGTGANRFAISYNTASKIEVLFEVAGTVYLWTSTAVFKDPAAWSHGSVQVDTTASSGSRMILTRNGSVVAGTWGTEIPLNTDTAFNNTWAHYIGVGTNTSGTLANYFKGLISLVRLVDGAAVAPEGNTIEIDAEGYIKLLEYTGSYGTNGGIYDFSNNSAFGVDVKTNNNTVPSVEFEDIYSSASNLSTYTFASCDLGTPSAGRQIVVSTYGPRATAGSRTVSTMTINGVTATFAGRQQTLNLNGHEIWYASVPSGATGDIVITWSAGCNGCAISVWSALNLGPIQDVQGDGTSITASRTINIGGSSGAIAFVSSADADAQTNHTFSTAIERDEAIAFDTQQSLAVADYTFSVASNATTITDTLSTTGSDGSLLGVTFGKVADNLYKSSGFATTDQLNDVPFSDDAGNGKGNFPILSSIWYPATDSQPSYAQPARMTVKNGGLECGPDPGSAIATLAAVSGMKIYFESRGIGSTSASAPGLALGVGKMNSVAHQTGLETRLRDGHWIYLGDGNKINESGTKSAYVGAAIARDAWVGFALDLSNGAVWARNTTGYFNSATEAEVEAGTTTNAMATGLDLDGLWTPTGISLDNNGEFEFNFGQHDFQFSVPSGFTTLATQNFSEPSIADPELQMDVVLDTGANIKAASEALYTYQFAWIKDRDNPNYHQLIDTVRGTSNVLQSSTTAAETTYSAPAGNSVAWVWKAGDQIVENTDGTITSSVSANTTNGFSIVSYTGTGVAATVGHGQATTPKLIIVKNRTDTDAWAVYHASNTAAPETDYLVLNTAAATADLDTYWNDTAPTASVFSIGTVTNTNGSSDDIIAYCWSEIEGFSKFGSYTGNGSADGPFVYTGFKPRWIITKGTGYRNWNILDSNRSTFNPLTDRLKANSTDAEDTARVVDFLSNGFKIRETGTDINANAEIYIYAAFAETTIEPKGESFGNQGTDGTFISAVETADTAPDSSYLVINHTAIDAVTLNTDIKAFMTRDAGRTGTTNFAVNDKITIAAHGLVAGDRVTVSTSGTIPAGLTPGQLYYVINPATNDFEVSLTEGGAAVDITSDGTGTHTVIQWAQGTLEDQGNDVYTAVADLSGLETGTSMRYLIESSNSKSQKIQSIAMQWN